MSAEPNPYDEWLVVRCQLGERDAFDALIPRWAPPLRRYVERVTGDPATAEDVVQEIWLAALRGIGRLREPAKFRAWLFTLAHHAVMDRLRSRYRQPALEALPDDLVAAEPDGGAEADLDDLADLERGLAALPLVERDVLTLFYLRELSLVEIADIHGIPVGTVKSRLFRARRLLRAELEAQS